MEESGMTGISGMPERMDLQRSITRRIRLGTAVRIFFASSSSRMPDITAVRVGSILSQTCKSWVNERMKEEETYSDPLAPLLDWQVCATE